LEGSVNGKKTKSSSLLLAVTKPELKKSVDDESELVGISSSKLGAAGNDKEASEKEKEKEKEKEETKKGNLNSDVAVADADAAVIVTDAVEVRDQLLLGGGGSTKTAIGKILNPAARISEQAIQEGKSETETIVEFVPEEEALGTAETSVPAAVEGLTTDTLPNAPSSSVSVVRVSEIEETAMTVPGPEAINKEGMLYKRLELKKKACTHYQKF